MFYQNRIGRAPDETEAWLISCLAGAVEGQDVHMSEHATRLILESRKHWDNFLSRYSVTRPEPLATKWLASPAVTDFKPCLEDLFSETMIRLIETTAERMTTELAAFRPRETLAESEESLPKLSLRRRF